MTVVFVFSYLIASIGLQIVWSFGLLYLDIHAVKFKRNLHNPMLISLFMIGDWVSNFHSTAIFFLITRAS